MHKCPFEIGAYVTWNSEAPDTWRFIYTRCPMTVISARWDDGEPTEWSMRFGEGGMPRTPGWIITVEYDVTSSEYYDPPLSLILGKDRITKMVHEMWLRPLKFTKDRPL